MLVPDLVVEILSLGNTHRIMAEKVRIYLDAGVPLVWVVDPECRTIAVHRPATASATLHEGDTLSGEDILPGFTLPVAEAFNLGM